ncbi:MAG TPA: flagellar motor switch protein FliG [Caldilineae bacterium]|nr:flagellar motor switch protein FliG [Caldilineae bacterium]
MAARGASVSQLDGVTKAAILLISLGPELSASVLRRLNESDVERLTMTIMNTRNVAPDVRSKVLQEAYEDIRAIRLPDSGGMSYVRALLERALGPQKAEEFIQRLIAGEQEKLFSFLADADVVQVANFLKDEHPQVIAVVLSHLYPAQSAKILANFDPDLQVDVCARIAAMDRASPEVLRQVEQQLRKKLATVLLRTDGTSTAGGVEFLVKVLNQVDRGTEKQILQSLAESDPQLYELVQSKMFVFEDLRLLDDRSIQRVLQEVDRQDLLLALRGASEEIRQLVYRNLSKRAAQLLKEDLETMGPVRLRNVEAAQHRIVSIIRRLEEAEEIVVVRGEEDILV